MAIREKVASFGHDRALVGVYTPAAAGTASGRPAVLLLNSGILHRVGPNRLYVELARAFAAAGFPTMRFDLSGIGDSAVRGDQLSLEEGTLADIRDAIDQTIKLSGATRVVLAGLCLGADTSWGAAITDDRVVGVGLWDPYTVRTRGFHLRELLRRLLNKESWLNIILGRNRIGKLLRGQLRADTSVQEARQAALPAQYMFRRPSYEEMRDGFAALVARGTRMCCVFTGSMKEWYNYERQMREAFPTVPFGDLLEVHLWSDSDHTFSAPVHKEALRRAMIDWLQTIAPSSGATPAPVSTPALAPALSRAAAGSVAAASAIAPQAAQVASTGIV